MTTRYVIRTGQDRVLYYAGANRWTAVKDLAYPFDFLTTAELYALTELDLRPSAYTVELVADEPTETVH